MCPEEGVLLLTPKYQWDPWVGRFSGLGSRDRGVKVKDLGVIAIDVVDATSETTLCKDDLLTKRMRRVKCTWRRKLKRVNDKKAMTGQPRAFEPRFVTQLFHLQWVSSEKGI